MRSSRPDKTDLVRQQFRGAGGILFPGASKLPKLIELRLDLIRTNPDQPRKVFDEASLAELARSIEHHGLIQPVTVKRIADDDGYLLVAGERRLRAVRMLGQATITAIITQGDPDELALIENLQREDLKAVDQAEAIERLVRKHAYTQEQAGRAIGKARTTISEFLLIARLPESVKQECRQTDTPKSVLLEIARLDSPEEQIVLWRQLRDGDTVRAVREARRKGRAVNGQDPAKHPTWQMVLAARSLLRRIKAVPRRDFHAAREHRTELLRIKAEIDQLLQTMEGPG
jgi:ParB family chromosome partitioning protein